MTIQNNLPAYAGLFGNLDFKEGDQSRTVYSPAAYLVDLLQLLEDEFDSTTIDFNDRRDDIKDINLDEENTNTVIPYLDIVNEVLEGRIESEDVYGELKTAQYPFNMPFSLENEKIKNHLKHLDISAHELRRLFATSNTETGNNYTTVAREYLGLSAEELAAFVEPTATLTQATLSAQYGYSGSTSFTSALSQLSTFLEKTDLEATQARALLYHDLYIDSADHSVVELGRENFYINTGFSTDASDDYYSGFVALNSDETTLEWVSLSHVSEGVDDEGNLKNPVATAVPLAWFDRVSRFVRFAQKTGLSFIELDLVLRQCCQVQIGNESVPTLSEANAVHIAQVVYLHKTHKLDIDVVVALLTNVNSSGHGNDDLPADQFNRIFNLPCVKVDNKYIHVGNQNGSEQNIAEQYVDTTYNDYSAIVYYPDLFSDENDDYRKRLRHTLGFTTTDLINITNRFEYEEVADSSMWESTENEWALLNYLYRVHALSSALDVHFLELFTLFDLLEYDPYIGRFDSNNYFVYNKPDSQKCFQVFLSDNSSQNINDKLWLLESLTVLNKWMKEYGYSADLLWNVVNGTPTTDAKEQAQDAQHLALYNALLTGFKANKLTPDSFGDLGDERAAKFAYRLVKHSCGSKHSKNYPQMNGASATWLYEKNLRQLVKSKNLDMEKLAQDFLSQLALINHKEFAGLSLGEKLQQKLMSNLVTHNIIDGEGVFISKNIIESGVANAQNLILESDFSEVNDALYALFHDVYLKAQEAALVANEQNETDEEVEADASAPQVQIFKSDLQELGLSPKDAKELYSSLMFHGYIDEEGKAPDPAVFADAPNNSKSQHLELSVTTDDMQQRIIAHFNQQLGMFAASKVTLTASDFADTELDAQALDDLIINLKQNDYLDENGVVKNPLLVASQNPDTMQIPARFYPQRKAIYNVFKDALATNMQNYLVVNKDELKIYCDKVVSAWVYGQLQGDYLDGKNLTEQSYSFFADDEKQSEFTLSGYFDQTQRNLIFTHVAGIIDYANDYKLTDATLSEFGFDEGEIAGFKGQLVAMGAIDANHTLQAEQAAFFKSALNADSFTVKGFEDYDRETFFALHELAKNLDNTVTAIETAIKDKGEAQQQAIIDQLAGIFGIDSDAVSILSKAIFKTENDLHVAWLAPLFSSANVLNTLDHLPVDMIYTQNVKRIAQFAQLVNKLQLSNDEITIALNDQNIVAKFPEDLILPDSPTTGAQITSIDALLEADEFVYIIKDDYFWVYLSEDYSLIDKKVVVAGVSDLDDDLLDLQKQDEELQERLKEDPIRQLFEQYELSQVDAAIIDKHGTWCIVSGENHYVRYEDDDSWDIRDNTFGQVDNDFENLEMIDSSYVDDQGRLFLINNDTYVRYTDTSFATDGGDNQPSMDSGYPKSLSEDWADENLPVVMPEDLDGDIGPIFDGLDDNSYVFTGNTYTSSEDGVQREVASMWGRREHDFGAISNIDAAMTENGSILLFSGDKVVKYNASVEQYAHSFAYGNDKAATVGLAPQEGYPKPIVEHFNDLPDEFVCDIDAAFEGLDGNTYLFRDDEYATIVNEEGMITSSMNETNTKWGIVTNDIAENGRVDAAFIGLDGRTYLFSGSKYVRYSGTDYNQVDDGFPRDIAEDFEGLTLVTAAFVLGNKTYLFGSNDEDSNLYVRYYTVHGEEGDYLEVDEEDPNARTIETVLANRPDVQDIEVFPSVVNEEFWSLPVSVTGGAEDFQIDAIVNGPDGKVFMFYGEHFVEHDHLNRWWSEPKVLSEQWNRVPAGLSNVQAGFTSKDGQTYLFFDGKFIRFSDLELRKIDNGYPRQTRKYWGKIQNNIEKTGQVDAALVVESRWEEQDKNGQLVDFVEDHTYLFSGNQFYRYKGTDYTTVEQGYPRHINRLADEPRFKGLGGDLSDGIDAAFADRRQVYLFSGEQFFAVIGDEDNYLHYNDDEFAGIGALAQEKGLAHVLRADGVWYQFNHLDSRDLTQTPATPRVIEKAQSSLSSAVSTVLHGVDNNSYVFAGERFYDVALEKSFAISDVWGRSRNPIYDNETIDAAFVGRDGVTYVFSGEWFVEYHVDANSTGGYVGQTVVNPPRRIDSKFHGIDSVALAYVFKEQTYLFEQPDEEGLFGYLRYSKDSYERADAGYPAIGDSGLWQIPSEYVADGFDVVDAIFVHEDNLIFISDQRFLSFDLRAQSWSYPKELELLYAGIPFNKTDFKDLKSAFAGADGKTYFFSDECYVSHDNNDGWSAVSDIKDDWGLQTNIFENGVDAAYVSPDGVTYLFAGSDYVRYSQDDERQQTYRYIDEEYPKKIATYLADEDDFAFMPKEFQQHLNQVEAQNAETGENAPYFNGLMHNGRMVYIFTQNGLFTSSEDTFAEYEIDGLGSVPNNFTQGGVVDAAFVDVASEKTYLFSGEQYICYTGDGYRFIDDEYPKIISESLAADLGLGANLGAGTELPEDFRDGIDAAFHLTVTGVVLLSDKTFLAIDDGVSSSGKIEDIWGKLDNSFTNGDNTIDGAFVDNDGALHVFKGQQFVVYSDTEELFELNPYNEARFVDSEYPQDISEQWPHLDSSILLSVGEVDSEVETSGGVSTIFRFEDQIYFHTGDDFVTHEVNLSDQYEQNPVQVLAYRWGEWSDYLLSDVLALTRFKDLNDKFSAGDLSLTEFVNGSLGEVKEPYMAFAGIFGFEKEDVRWLKQRNGFLPQQVNVLEEAFSVELVLRLYDILSVAQRVGVDVSSLYNDVWMPLYDSVATDRMQTAADGAYNALVQVGCDSNYEVLVEQINDELNVIKRDALVPYVIYTDDADGDVTTTRGLYQKLLIDIQMSSCAKTSRIKEATAAIQLYLHRCLVNLEDVNHDVSDQEAAREQLKDRWEWLQNYRVWEANRKVFLYPENYIRPELRDVDTKSAGFESLEESLTQGDLTEGKIEESYYKFLDAFTEASELSIAGGYIYDDGEDKKLLVLGRTRTDPIRYFYRFGTFVGGSSNAAIWTPWEQLDIPIEATRVEPVYAFNRVFIFWTTTQEVTSAEDASSGSVTVSDDDPQKVNSSTNSTYEAKIYYSFYNLNKQWTQPQSMQTEFGGSSNVKNSRSFSEVELFVENTTKLASYDEAYENIYIGVRYRLYGYNHFSYAAYHLAPELYSVEASAQSIENTGAELFSTLFPKEGSIEQENVVMLNYSANSVDGPWFAYNHNGAGFLVKPDAISASESDTLTDITNTTIMPTTGNITAAVQLGTDKDVLYFFDNGEFTTASFDSEGNATFSDSLPIEEHWGIGEPNDMQTDGLVDSAFVLDGNAYLTLNDEVYQYDYTDADSATGIDSPARLVKTPYALETLAGVDIPSDWLGVGASFTQGDVTYLFEKGGSEVIRRNKHLGVISSLNQDNTDLASLFGHRVATDISIANADVIAVFNDNLHVIQNDVYTVYDNNGNSTESDDISMNNVLKTMYGQEVTGAVKNGTYSVVGIIITDGGVWVRGVSSTGVTNRTNFVNASGECIGNNPTNTFDDWDEHKDWIAGVSYVHSNKTYNVTFHDDGEGGSVVRYSYVNGNSIKTGSKDVKDGVVTGCFIAGSLDIVMIDSNNRFGTSKGTSASELANVFNNSTGSLSSLGINNYFQSTSNLSLIGRTQTGIDAAFVGNGRVGIANNLYLFVGEYYYRFRAINSFEFSNVVDAGYPKRIEDGENNGDLLPSLPRVDAAFTSPLGDGQTDNMVSYFFCNTSHKNAPLYYQCDLFGNEKYESTINVWGVTVLTRLQLQEVPTIDAAYLIDNTMYLFTAGEYYTYKVEDGKYDKYISDDNVFAAPDDFTAAFRLNEFTYLFKDADYYRLADGKEPSSLTTSTTITGNWGNLPADIRSTGLNAAFTYTTQGDAKVATEQLFLIQGNRYITYTLSDSTVAHPYEIQNVNYEVIRLTSSTAEQLNQTLFASGVDGLLQMATQEINESPRISFDPSSPDNIQMSEDRFDQGREPTNSHLDFNSANGSYYWEVFFHAPFLIAQTLNADQKFEEAKKWYEYIYDPTRVADYWKFLPFLAADPDALVLTLSDDLNNIAAITPDTVSVTVKVDDKDVTTIETNTALETIKNAREAQEKLALALADYQPVFLGEVEKEAFELGRGVADRLINIESWDTYKKMISTLGLLEVDTASSDADNALMAAWKSEMYEVMAIMARLDYRVELMRNYKAQLSLYLDDPFDPHAIAGLRPLAYRKAIVMRYVDNLLDWGDMLFRQYTRESINEARMLYVFAYDLLGEKPENMGQVTLSNTKTYADFDNYSSSTDEDYNFLVDFENSNGTNADVYEQDLSFAATQFDTISNPYFYVEENELFTEYWDRVEDRLDKIRNCLNIDGVAVPLPLFQPPIDPMALVNAAASGGGAGAAAAASAGMGQVPDYRFSSLVGWSKELTGKLKGFSDSLLSTLEKKDSEELSLMQGQFEATILDLTTELKEESILEAHNTLANLNETKKSAKEQYKHYDDLISTGYLPEETTQLAMMGAAAILHGGSALGKYISGLSYIVPQFTAGPFSFGVTTGGENLGAMLQAFGEAIQSGAEALSMGGEVAGVAAQFKRSSQDWELQRTMADNEMNQLDLQIKAQENRLKMTKAELLIHKKEIENQQSISDFMKSKFSNQQLYSWMSGKISGLFFQTYKVAHDYAKQAEQAYVFEKGVSAGDVNYVNGAYWNSQKKGLMAGETLELDLDKMEKAYRESNSRGMEITKNISLLELDPLALMELKNTGTCTFRLSEAMFDYDFPGHYNRQIKTISLVIDAGEGKLVNATLTQLSSMQVLAPDVKAVKHLLDPSVEATDNVRANWRSNQQIALSHVDQYTENNGMFELNFNDERYLPFEGTGAVSNWRLELSGNKDTYNPADLMDVTVKLRYTAAQGGKRFASEVKGALKPYNATSFFDLAYNFPDQWAALMNGETDSVDITFTPDMFPQMSSSKMIGLFMHYEYEGDSGATLTINDDLPVANDTYLQPSTLNVGSRGTTWRFTLKGDRTTLKNAEMVLVYKAQV